MSKTKKDMLAARETRAIADGFIERGMGGTFPYVRSVRRRKTRSDRQAARRVLGQIAKGGSLDTVVDPRFARDTHLPIFQANGPVSRSPRLAVS